MMLISLGIAMAFSLFAPEWLSIPTLIGCFVVALWVAG